MAEARKEAQQIIEDARITANRVSEELKQLKKQLQESADASGFNQKQTELRRTLNEAEGKLRVGKVEEQRP